MIIGCYALHLYCDDPSHEGWRDGFSPGEYTGRTEAEAMREAKRLGWVVSKGQGRAVCPRHAGGGTKLARD